MSINTPADIEGLRKAGKVVALTLKEMAEQARPGMTTEDLDAVAGEVFAQHGARSAPQLVYGFPGITCISVNDEAVHGIPGKRVLQPGDVVKLDVTAELHGYIADAARTIVLAPASDEKQRLCDCVDAALQTALGVACAGRPLYEIGRAVEAEVERRGFRVLRELFGHGVGRTIHEEPRCIPSYEDRRFKTRLADGMVITLEPIIAMKTRRTISSDDGWTIRTSDGSLAAHAEHSLIITRGQPVVLTALAG